jgi:hypothetical protein
MPSQSNVQKTLTTSLEEVVANALETAAPSPPRKPDGFDRSDEPMHYAGISIERVMFRVVLFQTTARCGFLVEALLPGTSIAVMLPDRAAIR